MDVFLEREFEVNGVEGALKLQIGKPQSDGQDWYCEYQFIGVSEEEIRKAYGVDSVQALLLTLNAANALLKFYASSEYKITWLGGNDMRLTTTELSSD